MYIEIQECNKKTKRCSILIPKLFRILSTMRYINEKINKFNNMNWPQKSLPCTYPGHAPTRKVVDKPLKEQVNEWNINDCWIWLLNIIIIKKEKLIPRSAIRENRTCEASKNIHDITRLFQRVFLLPQSTAWSGNLIRKWSYFKCHFS